MSERNYIFNDITDKKFGKLTVLSEHGKNKSGNILWLCECSCGVRKVINGAKLRNGNTISCGCYRMRQNGHSKSRIYNIWNGMKKRCYDKNHDSYEWYGGVGINIHEEWKNDFLKFREWALTNGYDDNLSIDRIDNKGNYDPCNCRWITQKEQMNNVSNNKIITYKGKNYTQSEIAEEFDLNYHTVRNRLRLGWEVEDVINTPERGK